MSTRLFVGNLKYTVTEAEVRELFAQAGEVVEVHIPKSPDTQQPRGFGFVSMGTAEEAQTAIAALHGRDFQGRTLTVNEARPKPGRFDHERTDRRHRRSDRNDRRERREERW